MGKALEGALNDKHPTARGCGVFVVIWMRGQDLNL